MTDAKYYSDNKVDSIVEKYLPEMGYACDVGANDGKFLSNSLHFEEKGWTVLCVEPNPELEVAGRALRKLWRVVAAGPSEMESDFSIVGGYPYASNSGIGDRGGNKIIVRVLPLDRILEEAGFGHLDYLTADVEGYENEVMKGFTIERWKPKVIVLESWNDDQPVPDGYARIGRCEVDNIYLRNEPEAV